MLKNINLIYYISTISLCILLSIDILSAKETDYLNLKKISFNYSKKTQEYILVVHSIDPSTSRLKFDRSNIEVQLETKNNKMLKKSITRNDLTVINIGDFIYKGSEKHTMFRFNILLDNSVSIDDQSLQYIELILSKFIKKIPLAFEAQMIKFSSTIQSKSGYIKNKNIFIDYIKRRYKRGQVTALHDSIVMAIQDLAISDMVYFKFIVVITNNFDTGSQKYHDPKVFKTFFETECLHYNIPVFIVGISDQVNQTLLKTITDKNGLYIHVNNLTSKQELAKSCDTIANIINDTFIFRIPAIGTKYEDLRTIYLLKKNSVSKYEIIQNFIIEPIETNNSQLKTKKKYNYVMNEKKSYSLYIKTIPENANIVITNFNKEYYEGIKIFPGNYEVICSKEGYKVRRDYICIKDEDYYKTITLEKKNIFKPTKFKFPKKINYKVLQHGKFICYSRLHFDTLGSEYYQLSMHNDVTNHGNNLKLSTYIRIKDLFFESSISHEGRKKLNEIKVRKDDYSLGLLSSQIYEFTDYSAGQNRAIRNETEIATPYKNADLLSLFILLSKSVNDNKQLYSDKINLFVNKTSYIVACNCLGTVPYHYKGNKIQTRKFALTYQYGRKQHVDSDNITLVTLYIYKNLQEYTFPVCFEFCGYNHDIFKCVATDLMNK